MSSTAKIGLAFVASLVVILTLGTVAWRLRHNHPSKIKPGKTLEIRPSTGTLSLSPQIKDGSATSLYWIYVNKHIVAAKPDPREDRSALEALNLTLFPGDYELEVATVLPAKRFSSFPLSFSSNKVHVDAGKTTNLTVYVEISLNGSMPLAGRPQADPSAETLQNLFAAVNRKLNEYKSDPAALAIQDAYLALAQSPPVAPLVYINMPSQYGGGREYDATQVRAIVSWLDFKFWDWFDYAAFRDQQYKIPDQLRPQFDDLASQVQRFRESIQDYNRIAQKLEQAKS